MPQRTSDRAWLAAFVAALALSCSPDPAPVAAPPAPPAPTGAGSAPGSDAGADCGPAVEGQADEVRFAVLQALIAKEDQEAADRRTPPAPIVLAQEDRVGPKGQIFIHDVTPELLSRFAGRTPAVGNYSAGFVVRDGRTERNEGLVAFSTGDICWKGSTGAAVRARKLTGSGNRPSVVIVERRASGWVVTSLGGADSKS